MGSVINVRDRLLLVARAGQPLATPLGPLHPFAEPDEHGIVGESPGAWGLRLQVSVLGARRRHVLVLGESGTGKELVSRALHRCSERADAAFVSRNAATFPEGLIDAELFGNVRNYPNPGTPDRPGLVGQATGGTLFLDEIGELPQTLQAHLLRLLDGGEYQRLGEAHVRTADLRILAATNRPVEALKHDLAARFPLRLEVPPLRSRLDDVPLILRAMARRFSASDKALARAVLDDAGEPNISCQLVEQLLRDPLRTNVRRVEQAFWDGFRHTPAGQPLRLPRSWQAEAEPESTAPVRLRRPRDIGYDELHETLEAHGWQIDATWRALGLKDRYQLRRLREKFGLMTPPQRDRPDRP